MTETTTTETTERHCSECGTTMVDVGSGMFPGGRCPLRLTGGTGPTGTHPVPFTPRRRRGGGVGRG